MFLCPAFFVIAGISGAARAEFPADKLLMDVRQAGWQCLVRPSDLPTARGFSPTEGELRRDAEAAPAQYPAAAQADGWEPIRLGFRWEKMGHPELNDKVVWLRFTFHVPAEMKGQRFGFFATAVDDAADVFLNGVHLGRRVYRLGARIPEPVNVDLTPQVRFGADNLLILRVNDFAQARGGGVLGDVLLYRTLPFARTPHGGIDPDGGAAGPFSVVLHLGDALLARGAQTTFSAAELRALELPPYILRDDELVLLCPAAGRTGAGPYRVNLDDVAPVRDRRPIALRCDPPPQRVGQFELVTMPLDFAGTYLNPFDPRQANVRAVVETPSGKTETVPAFFRQEFASVALPEDAEILLPKPATPWRLYYRAREIGVHKMQVLAEDATGMARTPEMAFEVVRSERRGFLRVSKEDPRFFEFDNGDSYFGIGPSGWHRDANYIFGGNPRHVSTRCLDEYYRRKAAAGSNFDYCLAEFFGRLYTKGGFIDQHVAWKCEHRLRTLEELGIFWVTCYDDLCRSVIYGLDTVPYAAAQGGPCRTVEELYFNERSLEMQRDHLRYFVARMSDSPALLLWAIGDEGQAGNRYSKLMVRSWIKSLHDYVRTIDVYEHPHAIGEGPRSPADGGDAIIVPDWYARASFTREMGDAVAQTVGLMQDYGRFNCPLVVPEGGMVEWTKPADHLGPKRALYYLTGERWKFPEAISFHNHLWISLFQKNAVGGTEWLGQFIVARDQLFHATAIRNYLEGESLTRPRWEIVAGEVSHPDLRGFALRSEGKSLAWVQNRFYTWIIAGHEGQKPPVARGARVAVPVAREGLYRVEFWDTRTGQMREGPRTRSAQKTVSVDLPPLEKDVALKVVLVP